MAEFPPTPPSGGSGPANFTGSVAGNPFQSFDSQISYNDMIRYQMVSQYQQSAINMATMTQQQANMVGNQPRFNYGVQGGQQTSYIARQNQMNQMAMMGAGVNLSGQMLGMGAVGAGMEALGLGISGGILAAGAGFAISGLAPLVPMYFVNKGVERSIERQKYMNQIAIDVEAYRGRAGFNSLSSREASTLGSNLGNEMFNSGRSSFFNREQQMSMHQIGLSSGILTARGGGTNSGSIRQYQKNFEELKKTTEEIVKALQVTMEGGMSVIKELQGSGFSNLSQIRQQVKSAIGLGNMTGIGSQNMMMLGAAGAQSVQGTPYSAATGARTFQMGAVSASAMANYSVGGANAVSRVGGIAAAGAALGRAQLNVWSSGMGTKIAAYMMNPDGSINESAMGRFMSGKTSAYEITSGANATGYAMGSSRVRVEMFKADMAEEIQRRGAAGMQRVTQEAFRNWGAQKRGKFEDKAYAFASQFTNDAGERRLMYQSLIGPSGIAQGNAALAAAAAGQNSAGFYGRNFDWNQTTGVLGAINQAGRLGNWAVDMGDNIMTSVGRHLPKFQQDVSLGMMSAGEFGIWALGGGRAQSRNNARLGDQQAAIDRSFGLSTYGNDLASQYRAAQSISVHDIDKYRINTGTKSAWYTAGGAAKFNASQLIDQYGVEKINQVRAAVLTAIENGTGSQLLDQRSGNRSDDMFKILGGINITNRKQQEEYLTGFNMAFQNYKSSAKGGELARAAQIDDLNIQKWTMVEAHGDRNALFNESWKKVRSTFGLTSGEKRNRKIGLFGQGLGAYEHGIDSYNQFIKENKDIADLTTAEGVGVLLNKADAAETLVESKRTKADWRAINLREDYFNRLDSRGGKSAELKGAYKMDSAVRYWETQAAAASQYYIGDSERKYDPAYKNAIDKFFNGEYNAQNLSMGVVGKGLSDFVNLDAYNAALKAGGSDQKKINAIGRAFLADRAAQHEAGLPLEQQIHDIRVKQDEQYKIMAANTTNTKEHAAAAVEVAKYNDTISDMRARELSAEKSATTTGPAAGPAAPVLNYWNNSWSQ